MTTPTSKKALLIAAKKVFAEKGFEGATVKDLADEAGVNVSLVSYHFGGKEGLYKACLFEFASARVEAMQRILKPPQTFDELGVRLRLFAEEMTEVHINEPEICTILHRDLSIMNPLVVDLFMRVFKQLFEDFLFFVQTAADRKLIRRYPEMECLGSHIFGSLMHSLESESKRALMGRRSITDPTYREALIATWLEMTLSGLDPQNCSKLKETESTSNPQGKG